MDADDGGVVARWCGRAAIHGSSQQQITTHDVSTLAPIAWLNSEVINAYISIIRAKCHTDVVIMETEMLTRMQYRSDAEHVIHSNVQRWTRNCDVFQKKCIIFPGTYLAEQLTIDLQLTP
eukprot:COSAG02_NODE_11446_length_1721_cov_4.751694_2_plen_120_part_00